MTNRQMTHRITPPLITELAPDEVFVFGSNLAGIHGAGAAKQALQWGAMPGIGVGMRGHTYAIPTKDKRIRAMKPHQIAPYIYDFLRVAGHLPDMTFLVTEIGCGLAGHVPEVIAPYFRGAIDMENVWLPKRFWKVLGK